MPGFVFVSHCPPWMVRSHSQFFLKLQIIYFNYHTVNLIGKFVSLYFKFVNECNHCLNSTQAFHIFYRRFKSYLLQHFHYAIMRLFSFCGWLLCSFSLITYIVNKRFKISSSYGSAIFHTQTSCCCIAWICKQCQSFCFLKLVVSRKVFLIHHYLASDFCYGNIPLHKICRERN